MRVILQPPITIQPGAAGATQALSVAGLAMGTTGGGQSRSFWDPFGGWALIENNVGANASLWAHLNSVGNSGIGSTFPDFWNRGPMAITLRLDRLELSYEGSLWIGLGDALGNGARGTLRTNTTAKRIIYLIERDAAGGRQAYFVTCPAGGSVVVTPTIEPTLTNTQRVTVFYDRFNGRAQLFFDTQLILEHTAGLPTGAITNIWGANNSAMGVGVQKTPAAGQNPQRLSFIGFAALVP